MNWKKKGIATHFYGKQRDIHLPRGANAGKRSRPERPFSENQYGAHSRRFYSSLTPKLRRKSLQIDHGAG